MIHRKIISAVLGAAMTVSAVAVMPLAPAQAQSASAASCDRYARDYANSKQNKAGNLITGALVGALGGAAIGRVAGKSKVDNGLAIGAGVGAVGGLAVGSDKWKKRYNKAYKDCLNASYQAPAPSRTTYATPQPGTPEWYDYCRAKYRSFNPRTGLYLGLNGQYRPCQ